jgi:hypothetical protein
MMVSGGEDGQGDRKEDQRASSRIRNCAELQTVVDRVKEEKGLIQAAAAMNIDDNADKKPVTVTTVDPKNNARTTFDLSVSSHFVESS